jgi:hypothetical protein
MPVPHGRAGNGVRVIGHTLMEGVSFLETKPANSSLYIRTAQWVFVWKYRDSEVWSVRNHLLEGLEIPVGLLRCDEQRGGHRHERVLWVTRRTGKSLTIPPYTSDCETEFTGPPG